MTTKMNDTAVKNSFADGLVRQNVVLMSGLVTAPVIVAATTLSKALVLAAAFTLISFFTIAIGAFIPRRIVYTIRIILYVVLAAIVYMPVIMLLNTLYSDIVASVGIYIEIMVANSLILSKTESRFYLRSKGHMLIDVLVFCAGFSAVTIVTGIVREFLAFNTIFGFTVPLEMKLPSAEAPFFGFILIGVGAALCRHFYSKTRAN